MFTYRHEIPQSVILQSDCCERVWKPADFSSYGILEGDFFVFFRCLTDGGGFFLTCADLERMFNHSFPACIFFFFFLVFFFLSED